MKQSGDPSGRRQKGSHLKQPFLPLLVTCALLVAGLAGPAAAEVIDRAGALSGSEVQRLERDLERLGPHRVDVYYEDRVSGSAAAQAKRYFREERLGAKDAVIVVGMKDRKVGVHVGGAFEDRGVRSAVIAERIKRDFNPGAKNRDMDGAVLALAKGLIAEGASGGKASSSTTSSRRASSSQPTSGGSGGGGFWVMLLVFGAIAAGAFLFFKKRAGASAVARAIAEVKAQHARLVNESLKLEEVEQLARFADGAAAVTYKKLTRRAAQVLGQVKAFGERLETAEGHAGAGKHGEAEAILRELSGEADALGAAIATTLTVVERLERGEAVPDDMLEQVERLQRRVRDAKGAYETERGRAGEAGLGGDAVVEGRLDEANRLLSTSPVAPEGAEQALAEAQEALERYRAQIAEAEERRAYEARTEELSRANAAAAAAPVAFAMLDRDGHDGGFHGADASWGSSDEGESAEGSWGGDEEEGSSSEDRW